jgi:hypothetical protein
MSYEGSEEFICSNGHYSVHNCYLGLPTKCPVCDSTSGHTHFIDETNGYEENDPSTYPAPSESVGFDDDWKVDHYGNRYAVKIHKYRPVGLEWKTIDLSIKNDPYA